MTNLVKGNFMTFDKLSSRRASASSNRRPACFSHFLAVLIVLGLLGFAPRVSAASGDLDAGFLNGLSGANNPIRALSVQPDGSVPQAPAAAGDLYLPFAPNILRSGQVR